MINRFVQYSFCQAHSEASNLQLSALYFLYFTFRYQSSFHRAYQPFLLCKITKNRLKTHENLYLVIHFPP